MTLRPFREKGILVRAFACNGVLALYALVCLFPRDDYVRPTLASLLVFVVPGTAWLGLIRAKTERPVLIVFFVVASSLAVLLLGTVCHMLVGFDLTPRNFLVYLVVTTNLGLLLFRDSPAWNLLIRSPVVLRASLFTAIVYVAVFAGARRIPSLTDLDEEVPGASYGLVHRFRPYMPYNMGYLYYLAHPPLSVFYTGYCLLFQHRLDDFKFYYEHGVALEQFERGSQSTTTLLYLSDGGTPTKLVITREPDGFIVEEVSSSAVQTSRLPAHFPRLVAFVSEKDRQVFRDRNLVVPERAANVFLTALAFFSLYLWFASSGMAEGPWWPLVAALAYILCPGLFVRSISGTHLAAQNYILIVIAYMVLMGYRPRTPFDYVMWILPAVFAAWVNQKTIIIFAAIGVWRPCWALWNSKGLSRAVKNVFRLDVFAYAFGTLLFCLYAIWVDMHTFVNFYLREHIYQRAVSNAGLASDGFYPSVPRLWLGFVVEAPVFALCLAAVVLTARATSRDRGSFFMVWLLIGAAAFSIVDWKQTRHLLGLLPAIVPLLAFAAGHATPWIRRALLALTTAACIYGVWFLAHLMADFTFYEPTPPLW